MLVQGKRLAVFSIRKPKDKNGNVVANAGSIWTRAGSAWVNKDGSINLHLDVLPLEGELHVREAAEKRDGRDTPLGATSPIAEQSIGGH